MEKVKLILAKDKHAALLSALGAQTFTDAYKDLHTTENIQLYNAKAYHINYIKEQLKLPEVKFYIAYNHEQEVGFIKLIKNVMVNGLNQKCMELEKIYVYEQFYNKKYGALLMQKAIEETIAEGFSYLALGVWQKNQRALNFYNKFGFNEVGIRTFKLGSTLCDDYILAKKVKE